MCGNHIDQRLIGLAIAGTERSTVCGSRYCRIWSHVNLSRQETLSKRAERDKANANATPTYKV